MIAKVHFLISQDIWTTETRHQPESIKAKLTLERCRSAMQYARKAAIPTCPPTLEEVIDQLENHRHPPLYQEMYSGHVTHEVPASKLDLLDLPCNGITKS